MAYHVEREEFEKIAEEALHTIPKRYLRNFKNLTIRVEDYPGDEAADLAGIPKNELLGLFTGGGYPASGTFFDIPPPVPDAIVLYQRNIESICGSKNDLVEEIRLTLVHEVGHYFGMSDEELRQYE